MEVFHMNFSILSSFVTQPNMWLVKVTGEIDIFNSSEFKRELLELVNDKGVDICIDCSDLEYIDSTALGVLMSVLKRVKEYDGTIYLKSLKPNLLKLFSITSLDKIFVLLDGDNDEK
jgi:anti-sigma B factor antagonist